jgi:hypothetical protein
MAPGRLLGFCDRRTVALRQAMKSVEDIVGLSDGAGDLALKAIPIGRSPSGVSVEIALTGRQVLCGLVSDRRVGAGGWERAGANKAAQRHAAVAGESRLKRQYEGEG